MQATIVGCCHIENAPSQTISEGHYIKLPYFCDYSLNYPNSIVGYDTAALRGNGQATGVGASFLNVDNSDLTLGDVAMTGYGAEGYVDGQIIAKKLNGFGVGGTSYYWFDIDDEEVGTLYGWYDDEGGAAYNNVELVPGEGLWIYSPNADYKLQSSGAVPKESISVVLRGNGQAKLVVNPMPATLTLGKVAVAGYNGEEGYVDGQIIAKKLNGFGVGGTSYYWFDIDDEEVGTLYGWYDDEGGEDYNEVELAPGESLWIYSPSTDFSVVFPSPLIK